MRNFLKNEVCQNKPPLSAAFDESRGKAIPPHHGRFGRPIKISLTARPWRNPIAAFAWSVWSRTMLRLNFVEFAPKLRSQLTALGRLLTYDG
jgi:hypothetical protein